LRHGVAPAFAYPATVGDSVALRFGLAGERAGPSVKIVTVWTGYGPAYDALRAAVADRKRADPLTPVTVLAPTRAAGALARRALAAGVAGRPGIAGLSVLTVDRLAEQLATAALASSGRDPASSPHDTGDVLDAAADAVRHRPGLAGELGAVISLLPTDLPGRTQALLAALPDLITIAGAPAEPPEIEPPEDRSDTAIGRAVHGVLQSADLVTGLGFVEAVAAGARKSDRPLVSELASSALGSPVVRRAATRRHWRESYVATVIGDRVLEGVVDLLYRDDDGLVIVDYQTDAAPSPAQVDHRRPQVATYAAAVEAAVGEPVARCVLLFLSPDGADALIVPEIPAAVAAIRASGFARAGRSARGCVQSPGL
jgi:hypothetical protein